MVAQGKINRRRRRVHPIMTHSRSLSLQSIPEEGMGAAQREFDEQEDDLFSVRSSPTSVRNTFLLHQTPIVKAQNHPSYKDSLYLVNAERVKRHLVPFRSSELLNQAAANQVSAMALSGSVFHSVSSIEELMLMLSSKNVAENIQRGDSVDEMHYDTMRNGNAVNRANILSKHFTEFGSAVAMGKDGKMYCCQLFRS